MVEALAEGGQTSVVSKYSSVGLCRGVELHAACPQ